MPAIGDLKLDPGDCSDRIFTDTLDVRNTADRQFPEMARAIAFTSHFDLGA
jgi:hypothetical protein